MAHSRFRPPDHTKGDANTLGGYIFTAIVMVSLIAWVASIYVRNFGPKAKAREAAEAEARRPA